MTEQSTSQTQEPRDYTVTELDSAVQAGQITQAQRDQIFATQVERAAMRKATEAATQIVETTTRENALDGELQQYASAAPDLMREGSPLRARVAEEFEYLVSRGAPRDMSTELAAARAVMGPPDRARAHAQGRTRGADRSFDSFSGRPQTPRERREDDVWNRLTPAQQQYYSKQMQNGIYADRSAVIKELTWRRGSGQRNSA
jgi:hypothetical protein